MPTRDDYAVALLEDQFEDAITMSRSPHLAQWRRPYVQAFAAERAASFRAAADLLAGGERRPAADLEEAIGYLSEEQGFLRQGAAGLLDPAEAAVQWERCRQVARAVARLDAARTHAGHEQQQSQSRP